MRARNTHTRPMSGWYTRNAFFTWYMVREGTAVFLAIYAVVLLTGLSALARGVPSYERWLAFLASPLSIFLHILVLVAALYNAYTWFKVSPKAMPPIHLGKERLPDSAIIAGQYAAVIAVSVGILILTW